MAAQPRALVDRKPLLAAVAVAASVIDHKSTVPLLQCLRVSATQDTLQIEATDCDIVTRESLPAHGDGGAFDVVVNARSLLNLLRTSDAPQIGLVARDGGLLVCLNGGNIMLPGLPVADWPEFDTKPNRRFDVDAAKLLQGFAAVAHAQSTEETRYYLRGVFMHHYVDALRLVATDGHRLAIHDVNACQGMKDHAGVIIPTKAVGLLGKAWGRTPSGVMTVQPGERWCNFSLGGLNVAAKLIDGTFPDYMRVVPSNPRHSVQLDPQALKQAIAVATSVSDTKAKGLRLIISDGAVQLQCNADRGMGRAELACKAQFADNVQTLEIGFNSKYLTDMCNHAGDGLQLGLNDGGCPMLALGGNGQFMVLMPMRV